ncbi:MAG TPA: hypothetical protein ACHBX0_01635 [Arsenophonus sp.]
MSVFIPGNCRVANKYEVEKEKVGIEKDSGTASHWINISKANDTLKLINNACVISDGILTNDFVLNSQGLTSYQYYPAVHLLKQAPVL